MKTYHLIIIWAVLFLVPVEAWAVNTTKKTTEITSFAVPHPVLTAPQPASKKELRRKKRTERRLAKWEKRLAKIQQKLQKRGLAPESKNRKWLWMAIIGLALAAVFVILAYTIGANVDGPGTFSALDATIRLLLAAGLFFLFGIVSLIIWLVKVFA